jgi:hypothetical protein
MAVVLYHLHQGAGREAKRRHAAAEMSAAVEFAYNPRLATTQIIKLRYTGLERWGFIFADLAQDQVNQTLVVEGRLSIDDLAPWVMGLSLGNTLSQVVGRCFHKALTRWNLDGGYHRWHDHDLPGALGYYLLNRRLHRRISVPAVANLNATIASTGQDITHNPIQALM